MASQLSNLFKDAHDEGLISSDTLNALNVIDIGAEIQAALGVGVDDFGSSEVVFVTMLIDDSSSIDYVAGNANAVREGHNAVIDALQSSKQKGNVLIHTKYLNGKILYPYCYLDQTVKMNGSNYSPNGGTPLYDKTVEILSEVLAKSMEYSNNGIAVRTVTLIVTDGADYGSKKQTTHTVKSTVVDMLKQENHIIAAMGIYDGSTDFKDVFKDMGIPDKWVLTPKNTASDIRKAFQVFSQSAVKASQNAQIFNQTSLGGFGST
ncbi:MAG: hypothetical protein A2086_11045 [Spirochaetes bacterium GWD1_27_9]|nr:MAG: hypothetical protein A2Z98_04350 [Spirochaetes bacterium GWB1_27_13]OHD27222.1 MAG: hypothetical protein A2Y34_17065 [Spirochaetes bacterium GWC1_27_15]OHD41227.1 MAG: hypothetical protein A2086_11045 [Spirochaetes bacterium GWD1_27_9]